MSADPPNPFSAAFDDPKPNPYQSPDFTDNPPVFNQGGNGELNSAILVQQRVLSILMIVHGSMSLLAGLLFVGIAIMVPAVMAAEGRRGPNGENFDQMKWFGFALYGSMGLCGLVPGGLQIYSGIQNFRLRGYTLAIVALGSGVLQMFTCYCIPTALGLLIYGLIIHLHGSTRLAYELAKQGHNFDSILAMTVSRNQPTAPRQP